MAQSAAVQAPHPPALTRRQINLVFGTVMLGMLLAALDQTIVSTALPTIVGDLGGGGHVSWVVTSYLITDTIAVVLAGKFGDLFARSRGGRRRRGARPAPDFRVAQSASGRDGHASLE